MTINSKSPFIKIEIINDLRIVYYREDGSSAVYIGGSRNWKSWRICSVS